MSRKYRQFRPDNFATIDPKMLRFAKPCVKGHAGPDGQGIRYVPVVTEYSKVPTGPCAACRHKLPAGPFTHQFVGDIEPKPYIRTPEEAKAAHVQQVMEYNRRNPEKHRKHVKKYQSKPETIARINKKLKQETDEQREKRLAYQRDWYAKNRSIVRRKMRDRYYKVKEEKEHDESLDNNSSR